MRSSLSLLKGNNATAFKNILEDSSFKKRVFLEEQKAQKDNGFRRGRQNACLIYEHFRVTSTNESILDFLDLLSVTLTGDDVQGWEDTPKDDILEAMYRQKIMDSEQLKTTFAVCNQDTAQDRTCWKRTENGFVDK